MIFWIFASFASCTANLPQLEPPPTISRLSGRGSSSCHGDGSPKTSKRATNAADTLVGKVAYGQQLACADIRDAFRNPNRFLIGDIVWNLGTVHNIRQRKCLQPRLRRIGDSTGSQAHDAITDSESRGSVSDLAHDSDDVLAEYGRELGCDEQAGVSASLVVGVESWCTVLMNLSYCP
jgi:hypothetical protein